MLPGNGFKPGMLELAESHAEDLRRRAPKRRRATVPTAHHAYRNTVRSAVGHTLVRLGERLETPAPTSQVAGS